MRSAVTGVIRELSGGKVAAFGEIYEDSDETLAYGLDGAIADSDDHSAAVSFAVANADASGLEDAFGGAGGADSMIAMCAYTDTVWCPIAWMRPAVSASGLRGVDDGWGQRTRALRGARTRRARCRSPRALTPASRLIAKALRSPGAPTATSNAS